MLANLGRLEESITSYDRVLQIKPNSDDAWFSRGVALRNLGRLEEASASFDQALKIQPNDAGTWFFLGLVLNQLQRYEAAIASFDQSLTIQPNGYPAWCHRSTTLFELQQYEAAIDSIDRAIAINSDAYDGWHNRGLALDELQRYDEAITSFDQALQINPDYEEAWWSRGNALRNMQRYEEAISSYNQALRISSNFFDAWNDRGIALFELQRYKEAINSYEQALKIQPNFAYAWNNRGNALRLLEQNEDAVVSFDRALAIDNDYYEAWHNRGDTLTDLGNYKEAITSCNFALAIQSKDYKAWIIRGKALWNLQQHEEAIASFDQAIQINPDEPGIWSQRGAVLNQLQKFYEEEVTSLDQEVQTKPDDSEAQSKLEAALHQLQKYYEEAISSFDGAIQINPNNAENWYNRGVVLLDSKNYEESIPYFKKALSIEPDFYQAQSNLGSALSYLQRDEEAILNFDEALVIQPDFYHAWIFRGNSAGRSVSHDTLLASLSPIARQNPVLNQRGYEGQLASYEEGLKYVHQDTHPEGWGQLHRAIGNAHYDKWRQNSRFFDDWHAAIKEYEEAHKTLKEFPQAHFELLQDFIRAYLTVGLGQTPEVEELQRQGSDLLQELVRGLRRQDAKRRLSLKFSSFDQLTVDLSVQSGQIVQALEIAEKGKNACLTWLIGTWEDETNIESPDYSKIQQLLNPKTAVVYWHISPTALNTFILIHNVPVPITITTSIEVNQEELPVSVQRLRGFENWVKDWNQQYIDYRNKAKDKESHSWRTGMEQRLEHLKNILNIPAIEQELKGITQLILIPHRDLHRFPLHALFNSNSDFRITYLPSAQIGINLQRRQPNPADYLLSVEDPDDTLNFAKFESEAISQMFNSSKRLKSKHANKKQVKDALSGEYSVFHFNGHGIHNFNNPQESELALADGEKLTLEEIYLNNLSNYNLVTLSACETAITGNQTITTEYVGLVSGFVSRRVAFVVSTLWTVESTATALVMIEFYRLRQVGKSEPVALVEAIHWLKALTVQQLKEWYEALLGQQSPEFRTFIETELYRLGKMEADKKLYDHPYYWAAFTITGKPC
jgi:tetratricopeptide (TPR) repeat protein